MASGDRVDKKLEKQLGQGYYEVLLKSGAIVGIPKDRLAKELETSECNIDEMIKDYRVELADLMIHRHVAGQVFEPINRIRMTKMQQVLMDKIEDAIESDEIKPAVLVDLMKFFTKQLNDNTVGSGDKVGDIDDSQLEERALRLLEGGKAG